MVTYSSSPGIWEQFYARNTAALAEPRGTLAEPLWNPGGTLPQGRPGPPWSLSGLRPQSFQLLGEKTYRAVLSSGFPFLVAADPSAKSLTCASHENLKSKNSNQLARKH